MSKFLAALLLVFTGYANAAGPYDGIYNIPNTPTYMSVHQNGTTIILAAFTTVPATDIVFTLGDGQAMRLYKADLWDLLSGSISGNRSTIVGETQYGACATTFEAVFSASSVNITRVSIRNTPQGTAAGINCAAYQSFAVRQVGLTTSWAKVF